MPDAESSLPAVAAGVSDLENCVTILFEIPLAEQRGPRAVGPHMEDVAGLRVDADQSDRFFVRLFVGDFKHPVLDLPGVGSLKARTLCVGVDLCSDDPVPF